jgi:predicted transcriptional regulator
MTSLEIRLDETTALRLQQAAEQLGLTTEDLLRLSVQEKLDRLEEVFRSAADYVFDKNTELYRRLA